MDLLKAKKEYTKDVISFFDGTNELHVHENLISDYYQDDRELEYCLSEDDKKYITSLFKTLRLKGKAMLQLSRNLEALNIALTVLKCSTSELLDLEDEDALNAIAEIKDIDISKFESIAKEIYGVKTTVIS